MKRIHSIPVLIVLLVAASGPAFAGFHYKASTWMEGEGTTEVSNMSYETWVDGESAAIVFLSSGNPFLKEGDELITKDAGRTVYKVDHEAKTYSIWDVDAWVDSVGRVMQGMGPLLKFKIENAEMETLERRPGGRVAGQDTEFSKIRTTYDVTMKVIGIGQKQHVESIQESWVTYAIEDPAIGVWIQRDPPDMGDPTLNELIELEMSKLRGGFPVKTIVEQVTTTKKGKETRSRTLSEVEILERTTVSGDRFEIDSSYTLVPATPFAGMQAQAPPEQEEEPQEKKGRFRKLLKRPGG